MWQIDNRTPFAAERSWVRGRDGTEIWLVAVKASFDITADGKLEVAREQPPVLRLPLYHGVEGASSIRYEADLVLTKKTSDVLVVGHAWAPAGTAVVRTDVGLRVGSLQKVLRVFGDRVWGSFGPSAPEPFQKMPLVYERAYGGVDAKSRMPDKDWDWRNPVGCGYAVSSDHATGMKLPNIEYPDRLIGSWRDRPPPAGFGPIASHWQPRAGYAGTYDAHWMATRQPLLADDLDDRHFQCAPADQQTQEFLRGGEPVTLLNLHPRGRIHFTLPKLSLGFDTRFDDGSHQLHQHRRLHTVILEPDLPRVSLVWHSMLPCHFRVHQLERTIVTLKIDLSTGNRQPGDADLELA